MMEEAIAALSAKLKELSAEDLAMTFAFMIKSTDGALVLADSLAAETLRADQAERRERALKDSTAELRDALRELNALRAENERLRAAPAGMWVKQWEFDAPYSLVRTEGLGGVWFGLSAHGVRTASFSVASWGSEQACIEAAWHHAYGFPVDRSAPDLIPRAEALAMVAADRTENCVICIGSGKDAAGDDCDHGLTTDARAALNAMIAKAVAEEREACVRRVVDYLIPLGRLDSKLYAVIRDQK
ncbi:hypothetical protein KM176_16420 [Pseudooceanicola sp. CBS1P-1]|uniref:Uncharacterized protein n=1 Tax=Pseudooceanicola albus TaxID=2692189 RepID=A0A6L7G6I4_9RHOB|nr:MULTISPECIES: hypothetical protein [Pseudooceanicola]MBT9385460.1 hypothetical protein [Pseudooceanicola endophyticus]MXN19128.1 hypothetical protein [Pseudooceanicola albus]